MFVGQQKVFLSTAEGKLNLQKFLKVQAAANDDNYLITQKNLKQIIRLHRTILKKQNLYCEQTLFQEHTEWGWKMQFRLRLNSHANKNLQIKAASQWVLTS